MKFQNFRINYDAVRQQGGTRLSAVEFYKDMLTRVFFERYEIGAGASIEARNTFQIERLFVENRRPYYRVYPSIIKALLKVKLDKVPSESFSLPVDVLEIQLPEGDKSFSVVLDGEVVYCRAILAWYTDTITTESINNLKDITMGEFKTLAFYADFGERIGGEDITVPLTEWCQIYLESGKTLQDCVDRTIAKRNPDICKQSSMSPETVGSITRFLCGLSILSTDEADGIVKPEVLEADKLKYEKTRDPKFIEKAKRVGKIGWTIGEESSIASPHIRSAHMALFWTGPGRTIARIRHRRGCVVRREDITKVPTGYADDDELLVESAELEGQMDG